MTLQEKRKTINSGFNKLAANVGEVKDKSAVPFEFIYNGPYQLECLEKTCGCTANLSYDSTTGKIKGTLNLDENPQNQKKEKKFDEFEKVIRVYFEPSVPTHKVNNFIRVSNTDKIITQIKVKGTVIHS